MRKNFFCKLLTFILLTVVGCVTLIRCGGSGNETPEADEFDVSFVLPSRIEAAPEGLIEFVVKDGKAPLQSDVFLMESLSIATSRASPPTSSRSDYTNQRLPAPIRSISSVDSVKSPSETQP